MTLDVAKIKRDFPILKREVNGKRLVYLDSAPSAQKPTAVLNAMDDICDLIQDATETLSLYDIRHITPETARLADIGLKCAERVKDVVMQLGIENHKFETIQKICEEIDRLESDADRVLRAAVSRLFREEQDVRELIKMKAIYELLEAVTDRCLDVANLAEGISLENS